MSSRLFQEVREKRGLVYSIYSFSSSYSDGGIFGIYAGTGEAEMEELLPVVAAEALALTKEVGAEEVQRAPRAAQGQRSHGAREQLGAVRALEPASAHLRAHRARGGDRRQNRGGRRGGGAPRGRAHPFRAGLPWPPWGRPGGSKATTPSPGGSLEPPRASRAPAPARGGPGAVMEALRSPGGRHALPPARRPAGLSAPAPTTATGAPGPSCAPPRAPSSNLGSPYGPTIP